MSIAVRRQIVTLGLSAVLGLAVYQPVWAARSLDYNAEQFVSVLNGLGYPVALGTPLNDARVQQAIRDFQVQYQLPVDGRINIPSQDLAADVVRNLQRHLNLVLKLKAPLPLTQFYGPQTEAAVKLFQQEYKLPATGIATLETRQKLAEVISRLSPTAIATVPSTVERPPDDPSMVPAKPSSMPLGTPAATVGNIYEEAEFRLLLQNLGYDIDPSQPLTDVPTQRAIRSFQQTYALAITGQADQLTQERAAMVVRTIRNNLKITMNRNFAVTAAYDADTIAAVKQFQTKMGWRVDGIASPTVRKKLDAEAKRVGGK
jgi:peptidoglycan hydrolase-like protein with peptidoglycan-binding domain